VSILYTFVQRWGVSQASSIFQHWGDFYNMFFADAEEQAVHQRVTEEGCAERCKKVGSHVMSGGRCDRWL